MPRPARAATTATSFVTHQVLRHRLLLVTAAAAMFVAPLLLYGQAPAPPAGGAQTAPAAPAQGREGGQRDGGQGRQGDAGRQGGGGRGRQAGPPVPPPRLPNGRVMLGNAPTDKGGLWIAQVGITTPLAPPAAIPFQPWAKALFDDRQKHELEPHTRCKASGVSRQFQTPYGVESVELPELQ